MNLGSKTLALLSILLIAAAPALGGHHEKADIVDTAVDGIITIDRRQIIDSFNPAAEKMFGWSAEEVIGQPVSVLMPSPYREEHQGYIDRYLRTGHARIIGIGAWFSSTA